MHSQIVILISSIHMHHGSSSRHSSHLHFHVHVCGLFALTFSFYLLLFLPSLFLFPFLFLTDKKFMANLYNSAKEGVDTNDVLSCHTGYEPKAHDFLRDHTRALRAAPELAGAPLLHDPTADRLRRLYTRGYALSSTSSASRSLSTKRFVCQSVIVVNVR